MALKKMEDIQACIKKITNCGNKIFVAAEWMGSVVIKKRPSNIETACIE